MEQSEITHVNEEGTKSLLILGKENAGLHLDQSGLGWMWIAFTRIGKKSRSAGSCGREWMKPVRITGA
jgi:hypothetical protein